MKKLLLISTLIIIFGLSASFIRAQVNEAHDTLATSTTWSDTVHVTADIFVPDNVTLTIQPGTYVEFQGHYKINVFGVMLAEGQPGDSITFTYHDTTGFYNTDIADGGWNGILFNNALVDGANGAMSDNDSSILNCCIIEYGKGIASIPYPNNAGGAVMDETFDKLRISRCHLRNNYAYYGGATYLDDCSIAFHSNLVENNSGVIGGAITINNGDANIFNNIICNNKGIHGGAIYFWLNVESTIRNNIVTNNYAQGAGGAFYLNGADPAIINNLVANNTSDNVGGAIMYRNSGGTLVNNTICNNFGYYYGGGIYFDDDSDPEIYNCIIWNNYAHNGGWQIGIDDENSRPEFYYCLMRDSINGFGTNWPFIGAYENIIDADPGFVDPSDSIGIDYDGKVADWTVQLGSPVINGGSPDTTGLAIMGYDLLGNRRVANRRIDMGSYEYHVTRMEVCNDITSDTTWIADTVMLNCPVRIWDSITLTINPGTYIECSEDAWIDIDGTILAIGTPQDTIMFTHKDTTHLHDSSTTEGGWKGFSFLIGGALNDNDTSVFRYCIIEHAKKGREDEFEGSGGAIMIDHYSKIIIDHCIIRDNVSYTRAGAILALQSNLRITNSLFTGNYSHTSAGAIYYLNSSDAIFANNIITGNTSGGHCGGLLMTGSDLEVINCTISHNRCINPGARGGGLYMSRSEVEIIGSKITNNVAPSGGAIYSSYQKEDTRIINSLVANNSSTTNDGTIRMFYSDPQIINSTIAHNNQGFYLVASSPEIHNSILWNNGKYEIRLADNLARPDLRYSDIYGGTESFVRDSGVVYTDEPLACIDSLPDFIEPTPDTGSMYIAAGLDWNISAFSPCINTGNPDSGPYELPWADLADHQRMNDEIIDMGALENQDGWVQIVAQPENQFACEDDSISFVVEYSGIAEFEWRKDNAAIPLEGSNELSIPVVNLSDEASYSCIIRNSYGSVKTNTVLLIVKTRPTILSQPGDSWLIEDESTDLQTFASGAPPLAYQWFKDDSAIVEATSLKYTISNPDNSNEGVYYPCVSNACGITKGEKFSMFLAPQICMVTVSIITGNNLVVWEKNSSAQIAAYNVYRESAYAGIYDKLTTIDADDYSIFIDTTANPTIQAYFYKITATDSSGNETPLDLCKTHKTVHLLVTTNPETKSTQLDWDRYIGFEYGTYIIFRSETGTGFEDIHQMASSSSTWADQTPGMSTAYYRVAALRPIPCIPTGNLKGLKGESGPYSHSMSNVENRLQSTDIESFSVSKDGLLIFPNPFSERATLQFPNPDNQEYRVIVRDLSGKAVMMINNITSNQVILERNTLKAGLYSVEVAGDKIFHSKIIIE